MAGGVNCRKLIVGLAAFLSGTAISSRIMHLLHRC
jgi:hypothetical protein